MIHVQEIRRRLANTGFTHMAVTHTVFGAPKKDQDEAELALPESLWLGGAATVSKKKKSSKQAMPPDEEKEGNQPQSPVKVLRRINAVLENLADVAQYTKRRADATANAGSSTSATTHQSARILQDYDLVALSPRNDATFQSVCKTATASDIIVLDYSTGRGGVQLPFKIRPADVKAAMARQAVFEIPYAPAILNRQQRKGLIQTWYDDLSCLFGNELTVCVCVCVQISFLTIPLCCILSLLPTYYFVAACCTSLVWAANPRSL